MAKKYSLQQYERDLEIISFVEDNGINLDDSYSDIGLKVDFLRNFGIRNLRVGPDDSRRPFVPVEECEDARISQVVVSYYETARRRVDEYENGERRIPEFERRKSIEQRASPRSLSKILQPDFFPEMFSHVHTDDGSLDDRWFKK